MAKLEPPASGVTIRMYRQGHGDCFLLATKTTANKPFYMLIDCGLWTGSEIRPDATIDKIVADIAEATGNRLDVVLVTHEHMDHVNGFAAKKENGELCFAELQIGAVWLSWTEDGGDAFANKLRERFNDTLLALAGADEKLSDAGLPVDSTKRAMLRNLLSFETGEIAGEELRKELKIIKTREPNLSAREHGEFAIKGITNKKALQYLRGRADGNILFLTPGNLYELYGPRGIRVYALGRRATKISCFRLTRRGAKGSIG